MTIVIIPMEYVDQRDKVEQIAQALQETQEMPKQKIASILEICGSAFVDELLDKTRQIELSGGLMVQDGRRRRTPGGVFFHLVKERLLQERRFEQLDMIFPCTSNAKSSVHRNEPLSKILAHQENVHQRQQQSHVPHRKPPMATKMRPRRKVGISNTRQNQPINLPTEVVAQIRPNQAEILHIIEKHIGQPADLYRRRVNPDTGDVVLCFRFPVYAQQQYAERIAQAAAEANVSIMISPHPHQQALCDEAVALLPEALTVTRGPSLLFEAKTVRVICQGDIAMETLQAIQTRYYEITGWHLDVVVRNARHSPIVSQLDGAATNDLSQNQAMALVRQAFGTDCYKVSANFDSHTLTIRFFFPDVAQQRYAQTLQNLQNQTGWNLAVYPFPHQGKLVEFAKRVLPITLQSIKEPSIHQNQKKVVLHCIGYAELDEIAQAQAVFRDETGWSLSIDC